ncbi:unnamed protein product [Ectocarpus sp. 6 AP-2014]
MRRYETLVRQLYQVNLFHPVKMGLTNITRLHEALGNPADGLPAVHIAGTNGKGSVAFKMARSLQLGGLKTGLFVSPHMSCFRERVQVDGAYIPESSIEDILPRIFDLCESEDIPATFFEVTTALAFQHFRESGVDAIVVETGLGGRLDATNILKPALTVVTSVGLDHTRILGDTVEQIALEKAGIFKPGVPALVGDGCPVDIMRGVAESGGCPFHRWTDVFPEGTNAGDDEDYDEENTRLAEAGLILLGRSHPELCVNEDALRRGVTQRPPCRFEVLQVDAPAAAAAAAAAAEAAATGQKVESAHSGGEAGAGGGGSGGGGVVTVVLDVAHNPPAIVRFFQKVAKEFPGRRIRVVAAFSGDKDSKDCLSTIVTSAAPERIHLAEASLAATRRATSVDVLASRLSELSGGTFESSSSRVRRGDDSVRQALRDAIAEASLSGDGGEGSERDVVVVCGTVFMMVDIREELGFDEPRDSAAAGEVGGSNNRAAQDNLVRTGTDG